MKLGDNAFEKYLSDNVELKLTESGNFYFEVIADHNAENIYVTKTFSCSLNVAEKPFADQYKLVTSTNDIADGDEVIVVSFADDEYYAMTSTIVTNITAVKATGMYNKDNGNFELEPSQTDVQIWELEEYNNGYALKQLGGENYIIKGSGNANTKLGTPAYYHKIEFDSEHAKVYVNDERYLWFYKTTTTTDFRGYTKKENNSHPVYLYKKDVVKELGELTVLDPAGDEIAADANVTVNQFDKITIECPDASAIIISDANDPEAEPVVTFNGSFYEWEPACDAPAKVKIYAEGQGSSKELTFNLTVTPAFLIMDGETLVEGDTYDVTMGTTLTVSYYGATNYTLDLEGDESIESSADGQFDFKSIGEFICTFTAYNGEVKLGEREMWINVVDSNPLGEISVKYGTTELTEDAQLPYHATLTISADNAERIKVDMMDGDSNVTTTEFIFDGNTSGNFTHTVTLDPLESGEYYLNVTADHNLSDDAQAKKEYSCYFTVVEPENLVYNEWKLVTSAGDLVDGYQYVMAYVYENEQGKTVADAMGRKNESNFIPADVVSINESGNLLRTSNDVMTLTLEAAAGEDGGMEYKWRINNLIQSTSGVSSDDYLYATASQNNIHTGSPNDGNAEVTMVEFNEDNTAKILFKYVKTSNKYRQMFHCFVNSAYQFRSYAEDATTNGSKRFSIFMRPVVEDEMEIAEPTFELNDGGDALTFMSSVGELHLFWQLFKGSEVVKDNKKAPARMAARAEGDDETPWTNKVANEGEAHTVNLVTEKDHSLSVQAKSVYNDQHGPETYIVVNDEGVISGVANVSADVDSGVVEYYNLQGLRVKGDQPGLYIRRMGNRVDKVIVK